MPKTDSASRSKLKDNKKLHRKYLTWLRMFRYGVNNFTRNAWLTTAATAVMTITLLIIFSTVLSRTMLTATVDQLVREETKPSIYLKGETSFADIADIKETLSEDDNVESVSITSSEQARKEYVQKNEVTDPEDLQTLAESGVTFPITFTMTLKNANDFSSLEKLLREDRLINANLAEGVDQLNSTNRGAISTLSDWADTTQQVGLVATGVFTAISMLIIFNTIRMAIFNRRDEIEMMKLIGADKGFIRGPFVVEAVMYGFFAAILATGIGYFGFLALRQPIADYGIAIDGIIDRLVLFAPLVLLAMMVLGATIGVVSSRLAVRRYLKV